VHLCHFQPDRLANDLLKWFKMPGRRPDLQLGVTAAVELNDDVFATIVHLEA